MGGQDFLEALEIAGNDFQDEVDFAVEHMAFAHFGNVGDMRFEGGEVVLRLAAQRHHREDGNREAEAGGIEIGVIAADHTRFLQRADAAQAGRRGEADAFGELDVGHAPILLQMSEDLTIDPIERHCVSHS